MDAHLWQEFAAPLRSFVAKRAPREVDTDDVLQDVFLRIQEQLPRLRDADRIDAWIFQIARNVVADAFRRRTRREAFDDRAAAYASAPAAGDDGDAEAELATCLAPMIEQLPEPYRQAIELTELRGMTQIDAARLTGISVSGMKSRVQRGRAQLKAIIGSSCRVEIDARGGVSECDPLRPSGCSRDSMDMQNTNETRTTEPTTTTNNTAERASTGCCGGPAPEGASACCALDAEVKSTGGAGCGCGATSATTTAAVATTAQKGCC